MTTIDEDPVATVWSAFSRTAGSTPDKTALTTSDGTLTFRDLEREALHLAEIFAASGVTAGTAVHTALPNGLEFLPAFLALRRQNVTVGLVSARYRDAEFRALSHRLPPTAYLTTPQIAALLNRVIEVREARELSLTTGQSPLSLVFPRDAPEPNDIESLAIVKFSSGSTGAPKGIGLTEANLLAEAANVVATLELTSSDRIVAPVPMSHSYGFDLGLLPVIGVGAEVVLRRSFVPREIFADLAHPASSVFLGVPSMYRILAEAKVGDVPDLSHVRYLLSCTAPLLPSLVSLCNERLGVLVCQHYGSSETGAAANHRPSAVLRRPGSVGIAAAGVDVRIVDDDGHALAAGTEGEIVIRSRAVSSGYVTDEGAAARAFTRADDGLTEYHTGDVGVIDDEGFIFWRGRKDQVINVGGLKVYPSEVAQVLERHPSVSGARVVAATDSSGEEVVHAIVTLSQSTREQDLLGHCRQHLADYKIPRRIEIAESISNPEVAKMTAMLGEDSA